MFCTIINGEKINRIVFFINYWKYNMTSWEYNIIKTEKSFWSGEDKTDTEQELTDLGRNGWELVSVVSLSQGGTTNGLQFFFKRKRF